MEFRGYYGKHKREAHPVRQTTVRQDNRLSCRLSQDTWNEIEGFMNYNELTNLSGVIETLLSDSLLDWKLAKQKYEIEGI